MQRLIYVELVQISRVTVGAHHAALVEVLAGRSETPHEPWQVMAGRQCPMSDLT